MRGPKPAYDGNAVNTSLILFAKMAVPAAVVSRGLAAAVVISAAVETSVWRHA